MLVIFDDDAIVHRLRSLCRSIRPSTNKKKDVFMAANDFVALKVAITETQRDYTTDYFMKLVLGFLYNTFNGGLTQVTIFF